MFDALTRLFTDPQPAETALDTKTAVAALLVHLASVDGEASPDERAAISGILKKHFELGDAEVKALMTEATRQDKDAVDLYKFTSALTALDEQERIDIIRLMWEVVFADDVNHEMEDNMVWRVAELIGVSARQRTVLRQQMRGE